jgi:hypothetical protein
MWILEVVDGFVMDCLTHESMSAEVATVFARQTKGRAVHLEPELGVRQSLLGSFMNGSKAD